MKVKKKVSPIYLLRVEVLRSLFSNEKWKERLMACQTEEEIWQVITDYCLEVDYRVKVVPLPP